MSPGHTAGGHHCHCAGHAGHHSSHALPAVEPHHHLVSAGGPVCAGHGIPGGCVCAGWGPPQGWVCMCWLAAGTGVGAWVEELVVVVVSRCMGWLWVERC